METTIVGLYRVKGQGFRGVYRGHIPYNRDNGKENGKCYII